jgi:3-hydroxyisobutyrate dehydrogenase-like beta-hydroxyacid dehydrogenase
MKEDSSRIFFVSNMTLTSHFKGQRIQKEQEKMSETIGFIGLGLLGLPIATNLLNAGYSLRVYNRTASKAEALVAKGAQRMSRPADVVLSGGIVATIVWDDAALESVVMSDGFLEQLGPDGIHLSMSTVLPETSKKLAALHAQHGSIYIDAPIFGRPEAAVARQLWIPFAGPQRAKERVRPLLKAMGAQGIFDFGEEVGAANIVKLVGNFLIVSAGHSIREALTMAEKNGVDPKAVIDMLTQTLFTSPIYQSHGKRMVEKAAPFNQSPIPLKDVGLFQKTAQQVELATPIASLLEDILRSDKTRA